MSRIDQGIEYKYHRYFSGQLAFLSIVMGAMLIFFASTAIFYRFSTKDLSISTILYSLITMFASGYLISLGIENIRFLWRTKHVSRRK